MSKPKKTPATRNRKTSSPTPVTGATTPVTSATTDDPTNHPKPIENAIRRAIDVRELTAYRVAKLSGASVDSIQRFLNRERGLTLATAEKLLDALGLSIVDAEAPRRKASS